MRILILSQWCFPEPDARILMMAKELHKKGHTVQILTGFPNYPGGTLYEGYRVKFAQKEIIDNIEILRVPLFPDHSNSAIRRLLNYLSFAFTAALWGVFWVKQADVMYVYHPPVTISIPALFLKIFRRIPVVYDIQDLWPDTLSSTGMVNSKMSLKIVEVYCKFVYRAVDHITVISQGFKDRLINRGVPEGKVTVIHNWTIMTNTAQCIDKSLIPAADKKFTILFAGTMGKAQALDSVLEAARLLQVRGHDNIQFAFIGGGISRHELMEKARRDGLTNTVFLERVKADKIAAYLLAADVLLVHLKNDPLFKITIPSKTQAYMEVGKPVIMAVGGDAEAIIKESKSGICIEPENPEQLAKAVITLASLPKEQLSELGDNGKYFFDKHLSITIGVQKFFKIFNDIKSRV